MNTFGRKSLPLPWCFLLLVHAGSVALFDEICEGLEALAATDRSLDAVAEGIRQGSLRTAWNDDLARPWKREVGSEHSKRLTLYRLTSTFHLHLH